MLPFSNLLRAAWELGVQLRLVSLGQRVLVLS